MKLSPDATIASAKLTDYLLTLKKRNDKSAWLAVAGYSVENWQMLEADLRAQILPLPATVEEENDYGVVYKIRGTLTGPNNKTLAVQSIWMIEKETGQTKFITMFPDKNRGVE